MLLNFTLLTAMKRGTNGDRESKNGPGVGDTEAANLSWGEVYSPEGGLVLGSNR